MIFVETKVFTRRILDAMSDDEYASLQNHLADHPDAGAMIPGAGGVRKYGGLDLDTENEAVPA